MLAAMEPIIDEHEEAVWLPTAAAAAALNISPRTLARRVAANQLPTKADPAGRKLVGVPAEAVNGSHQQPWPDNGSQADNDSQRQSDADKTALALAGGAVRGWQTAANEVKADLARSRRVSRLMGAIVAVFVMSGGVGIWWATKTITQAQGRHDAAVGQLEASALRVRELVDQVQRERRLGDDLAGQLRTQSAQLAVKSAQLDRARMDLSEAQDRASVLEATQGAVVVHAKVDDDLSAQANAPGG